MPLLSNGTGDQPQQGGPSTLAQILFPLPTLQLQRELEKYRTNYEARFGKTDLTKYYTSQWPRELQNWLTQEHPRHYYDGLPPFVKAWLREKMQAASRAGNYDDASDALLRMYVSGHMNQERDGPSR